MKKRLFSNNHESITQNLNNLKKLYHSQSPCGEAEKIQKAQITQQQESQTSLVAMIGSGDGSNDSPEAADNFITAVPIPMGLVEGIKGKRVYLDTNIWIYAVEAYPSHVNLLTQPTAY